MPSKNNLYSLFRLFNKSLACIKNKKGPRMEPVGTTARISTQCEHWQFKTTRCFLLVNKSFSFLVRSPHTPFWGSLKIIPASRNQGITLELQGQYQKHVNFMIDGDQLINTRVSRSKTWLFWGILNHFLRKVIDFVIKAIFQILKNKSVKVKQ